MFYQGERVRLLRELPELALKKHLEGSVVGIRRGEEGQPLAAEIRFLAGPQSVTAELPLDAIEPVVDLPSGCTAVLWRLEKPWQTLIEQGVNAMLDGGFQMRQGLNVMQLVYNRSLQVWQGGDKLSDPTGAQAVVAGSAWDGCIVAFSGIQRFAFEFRLHGRQPYVMLHQRWEVYNEQRRTTHP
ncbi:MAG TPA: hypothetical protein VI685_15730, partial [Candidatus Angelobacter sp.]